MATEPKFGDIGQEDSGDDGSIATFMVISPDLIIYLDDTDPEDKSLIGYVQPRAGFDNTRWVKHG